MVLLRIASDLLCIPPSPGGIHVANTNTKAMILEHLAMILHHLAMILKSQGKLDEAYEHMLEARSLA